MKQEKTGFLPNQMPFTPITLTVSLLLCNCFLFCRFLGSGDPNTFFSRAQRSRMVYEILATTPFGKEKKGEVGIERMVEEGAYSAAFPLHDVSLFVFLATPSY